MTLWLILGIAAVYVVLTIAALTFARAAGRAELKADATDRRQGPADRRGHSRPWAGASAGRRREDALRGELEQAHRALWEAEARIEEIERRRAVGD